MTGADMFRVKDEKKGAITGTKGYKWKLSKEWTSYKDVDMSFYKGLITDAVAAIRKVGDVSIMIDDLDILESDMVEAPMEFFDVDTKVVDITEDDLPF
jgi:hypothetical protein